MSGVKKYKEEEKENPKESNSMWDYAYGLANGENTQTVEPKTTTTPTPIDSSSTMASPYTNNIDSILGNQSTYALNGDELYQQYKNAYVNQAKLDAEDVMGQAAALTGGYGNSYAAMIGEKAYENTMSNYYNDVVPELYEIAIGMYGGKTENEGFTQAVLRRTTDNGMAIYDQGGKEIEVNLGRNPYMGGINPDTLTNGTWDESKVFSNGYQPNNIKGETLSKTDRFVYVNGVKQNVWKTPDGRTWVWDGTINKYLSEDEIEYED